jgi:predicted nucleotidyltransferase
MDENVKELLAEVKKKLKNLFAGNLSDIILYGSYARGDYDKESDIDILALVEESRLKDYNDKIIEFEIDLTIKYDIMPSILVENKKYFLENRDMEFLFQNVEKEGISIYAA